MPRMNSCPIVVAQNSWRRRRSKGRAAWRRAGVVSMTSAASELRRGTFNQPTVRSSVPVRRLDMPPHSATGAPVQPHAAVCRVSSGAASQSPCRQTECCRIADSARAGNPASLCRSRGADLLLLEHANHIRRGPRARNAAWCIVAGTRLHRNAGLDVPRSVGESGIVSRSIARDAVTAGVSP